MKIINGDIFKIIDQFDVLIHGCNCFNVMSKGFAKSIKELYPIAYQRDCFTQKGDYNKLGWFTFVKTPNHINGKSITIINAYTQYQYWGKKELADVFAIRECFRKIKIQFSGSRFVYPKIGAGLAGGDWEVISKIIDTELFNEDTTLVVL